MNHLRQHPLRVAAMILLAASVAAYGWLRARAYGPSWLRGLVEDFVGPGTTVWWLTLGGPFQTGPQSFGGTAWAAAANTLVWWLVAALLASIARIIHRRAGRS